MMMIEKEARQQANVVGKWKEEGRRNEHGDASLSSRIIGFWFDVIET